MFMFQGYRGRTARCLSLVNNRTKAKSLITSVFRYTTRTVMGDCRRRRKSKDTSRRSTEGYIEIWNRNDRKEHVNVWRTLPLISWAEFGGFQTVHLVLWVISDDNHVGPGASHTLSAAILKCSSSKLYGISPALCSWNASPYTSNIGLQ